MVALTMGSGPHCPSTSGFFSRLWLLLSLLSLWLRSLWLLYQWTIRQQLPLQHLLIPEVSQPQDMLMDLVLQVGNLPKQPDDKPGQDDDHTNENKEDDDETEVGAVGLAGVLDRCGGIRAMPLTCPGRACGPPASAPAMALPAFSP